VLDLLIVGSSITTALSMDIQVMKRPISDHLEKVTLEGDDVGTLMEMGDALCKLMPNLRNIPGDSYHRAVHFLLDGFLSQDDFALFG